MYTQNGKRKEIKKIENQQRIIEKLFLTISDLKRVIEETPARTIDLLRAEQSTSETDVPTMVLTVPSASETPISSDTVALSEKK